jgi:hypothetical protein
MGSGVAQMPESTVYFDFKRPRGSEWFNALGTMTVQASGITVQTPAGIFDGCIEIRARDRKKADTFWTFCVGVGPVRFGQGKDAFLLTAYHLGAGVENPSRAEAVSGDREHPKRVGGLWIGLDANPAASEGYSPDARKRRMRTAADSGVNFFYLHPKWNEVEKREGHFDFGEVDAQIGLAADHGMPVLLNVRVIDTNNRTVPDAYSHWSLEDPRMADRLSRLLRALAPHTRGRVKWVTIGNEVDEYFEHHAREVNGYAGLVRRVLPVVRDVFPSAEFTVNFTFAGLGRLRSTFAPITNQVDFYSFTYYPLNSDLTLREPKSVLADVDSMVRAAEGKNLILQEIGYASAERLHSSEQAQADFIHYAFDALRHHPTVIAANFVWMSDLPDSVVNDLAKYYQAAGSDNFRAYIGTLGYFDKSGRAKPAWEAFRVEAARR